jgi:diguanylate cyclase (GGDEF)-like protein/putative nucleotidyltransferase with HDIG domain
MGELPNKAKVYVTGTILLGLGIYIWQLKLLDLSNFVMLIAISIIGTITQVLKIEGTTARSSYSISWVLYGFAILELGIPGALLVIFVSHIVEWIVNRYVYYIPLFNIANYGIAALTAGYVYQFIHTSTFASPVADVIGILVSMAIFTFLNHLLVGIVINFARGQNFSESGVFGGLTIAIDFTLMCLGGLSAMLWENNPAMAFLPLIPLYLIYKALKLPALERETQLDAKTGLINTRYFNESLERELERANRFDRPITIVMADLDYLRNINNNYGHIAGDEVLIGIAQILKSSFRGYDTVARFGGEEFSILVPEATPEQVFPRIDRIRQAIEDARFEISTSTEPISATMSFGIAGRVEGNMTATEIVHNADLALYHAKANGRNRAFIYSSEFAEEVFSEEEKAKAGHTDVQAKADPVPTDESKMHILENIQVHPVDEVEQSMLEQTQDEDLKTIESADIEGKASGSQTQDASRVPPRVVIKPRPRWFLTAYIVAMGLLSVGLMALTIRYDPTMDWYGLILFAVMTGVTEWFAVEVYDEKTSVSTSAVPFIGGVLLFGPVAAPILGSVIALSGLRLHPKGFRRIMFNTSAHIVNGYAIVGILYLLGNPIVEQSLWQQLFISVISGIVVYGISTCTVGIAISLDTGHSFRLVWDERFRWLGPFYAAFGVVAFLFVVAYYFAGLLGALAVLAPLLILRLSQYQFVERTKDVVNQIRSTNVELQNQADEITIINEELLLMLAGVSDLRDPYVVGHSQHVSRYAVLIAEELGLSPGRVDRVRKAGLLHDIGKLGIAESILFKPGPLTKEEYESVKEHVRLGADILNLCHSLRDLIPFILHHHERFDGRGYPDGIKGGEIPLEARILGLADAVEAMASDRHYQTAMDAEAILKEVDRQAGSQFDPNVAKAFIKVVEKAGHSVIVNSARRVAESASSHVRSFPELALPVSEHVKAPWRAPDYY